MDEKKTKALDKIREEINRIKDKKARVLFFVLDTKGVASGSLEYIYKLAKIAENDGYDVAMLYQAEKGEEFVGVEEWLGKDYSSMKHYNIASEDFEILPSDVLFIPEIFSNVMNQTKKLPCKRIAILQNYNYMVEQMPFAAQWGDFGIIECLTNTQHNADLIEDVFPYVKAKVVQPYLDSMFEPSFAPKKMVINIVAKDKSDVNKVVKPFYWKFPTFKWVSFRDLRGFPKHEFAELLKDAAATVWIDDDTSFGYSALEAMKSGSIVIAKVPDAPLPWMDNGDAETMKNCCLWFDDYNALHRQIASVVRSWITDKVPEEIFEEAKSTVEAFSETETKTEFLTYLTDVFNARVNEMEILINNIIKKENENEQGE